MSKFSWTKEQEAAITDRNKSLLVSASAGSGKTTVMIARIIDLMLGKNSERTPITNFLIVTFTKASANDMKKKLVDKLLELEADDFVLEQIENVAIADISDLHSFYSKLISTYFYEAEIDPAYRIVDGDEAANLKEKAISKLFEEKEKLGDENYFRLFDIFQKKRKDTVLKETIYKFNDFLNSINDGESWFAEKIKECYNEDLKTNICANLINSYVANAIFEDAKMCDEFAEKCSKLGCLVYFEYFSEISSILRTVNAKNSYAVNAKNIGEIEYPRAKRLPKEFEYLKDEAEFIKTEFKTHVKNYKENYISDDEPILSAGIVSARRNLESLFELVQEFNQIYSKLKKDINGLDFNDLEKYALKILENDAIRKAIQKKYKYVFVDEYQDVNEVQEKIVSIVAEKNNRFMVGDIKQSIYRFRHCDPEIFISKSKEYSKKQDYAKLINLNCNFRSDKKILRFVDEVFSGVMTESFGGVDYAKESKFVPGEGNFDKPDSVNLCYIDTTKTKAERQPVSGVYSVKNHVNQEEEETEKAIAEANYVASKIAELVSPLSASHMSFGDIAILVQSRNDETLKFLDVLRAYGIPISSDEKYDLMQKNYTQEIINFIKYVCAPKDDILLFKVLKSKLFNFSDNELVEIRKLDMKARFFDVIKLYQKLKNEILQQKVEDFLTQSSRFASLAKVLTLQDLARQVVADFELQKINLFDIDGDKINDEIDKFISRLPNKTAYEFLISYPEFSMVFENECSGDAVNVMTIHKSKGIEFKAVFVINTSKAFNLRNTSDMIIFNKQFGLGLDYFDEETRTKKSSIPISAIRIFETRKLVEEQQRLLYVALTRSIEKLFVVCSKPEKNIKKEFAKHPTSFINWFEPIIYKELQGEHNEDIKFEKFDLFELNQLPQKQEKQILFSETQVEELKPFVYEYESSTKVPLKNSISKIIHKNKNNLSLNSDDNFENFRFEEDIISSADRGTIYHRLFELIDLKNLDNIDHEFEKAEKLFDKNEWAVIDKNLVKNVFAFDFFKQINSDDIILKEREFFAKVPASVYDEKASQNDEFIMQGVIDLLIIRGNEAFILDYKTGKMNDEKIKDYTFQINTYAKIAEKSYKIKINKKLLCFVDLQKILEI